jgi:hypothetical protein
MHLDEEQLPVGTQPLGDPWLFMGQDMHPPPSRLGFGQEERGEHNALRGGVATPEHELFKPVPTVLAEVLRGA